MGIPKIVSAKPINDHTLLVDFDNNERKTYDITPLLSRTMFEPLQNPVFFRSFSIEHGGYAIIWNEDIDLSENELWSHGKTTT